MKKVLNSIFIVLALVLTFAIGAFAQETTGIIEITSKDPNGAVVPNVAITVANADVGSASTTGFKRTLTTDENGFVRFLQVPPGVYTVTAAATAGFAEKTISNVNVVLGKPTPVSMDLGITSTTNIEVSAGEVAPVDTTDSKIQTNISAQAAELLPKGTNFSSILKVSPATRPEPRSGQFQIDGASGSENTFIVDGQEVTNVRTGTLDANSNLPFALIQEVQIKSSGFEAEYGGATGGVVSVVTKGGSNTFSGEFGVNFRPSSVNAIGRNTLFVNNQFEAEYYPTRRDSYYEFNPAANLRGPILKDKLWFFVGYNPQIFHQERTLHYVNATNRVTQTFPNQDYRAKVVSDYTFVRLDAQPISSLRLTGSYIYNPISVEGGIPGYTSELFTPIPGDPCQAPSCQAGNPSLNGAAFVNQTGGRQNSQSFTGQGVWTPRSDLIVAARIGHYFLNDKTGAYGYGDVTRARVLCSASSRSPFFPAGFGCTPGQSNGVTAFDGTLFDVTTRNIFDADATYMTSFFGRHELKGGMQNNRIANRVDTRFSDQIVLRAGWTVGEYSGISSLPSTPGAFGAGLLRIFQTQGDVSSSNLGLFFQDKWQPTRRLTLNLGFRTEREDVPSFTEGLPGIKFDFADKIAPRLGAAYDLTGDGKTKLSVFYGWFYDRFKYELPRGSFGGDIFHDFYYELLPGTTLANYQTRADILGPNGAHVPGGTCPTNTTTPVFGRVRCDIDFRVPSNAGLPLTEAGGIDPNIKAFRQSEFTVGFERDLGRNFVVRARYSYKNVDHAIEDAGFPNDQASEYYIIGNPGEGLYKEQADNFGLEALKPKRRYDAIEVVLDRRFANDYQFNVNYTWSRLVGNYSGLASSDEEGRLSPNVNRYFDQPQAGWTVAGGPDNGVLNTDRPHVLKFNAAFTLDWNKRFGFGENHTTDIGLFGFVQSGTPLTSTVVVNGIDTIVLRERGDMGRTPTSGQIDVFLRHRWRFGADNRYTIVGETDILNLFNWATATNFGTFLTDTEFDVTSLIPADQQINCAITGDQQPCLIAGYKIFQQQGAQSFLTAAEDPSVRYPTYNLASSFQGPRQVRFGIRFLF